MPSTNHDWKRRTAAPPSYRASSRWRLRHNTAFESGCSAASQAVGSGSKPATLNRHAVRQQFPKKLP